VGIAKFFVTFYQSVNQSISMPLMSSCQLNMVTRSFYKQHTSAKIRNNFL